MELWNEYEGRTIDGAYPLVKLLQPEGRSAFFSTSNGTGEMTVIRLIESHYDDDEILARWRGVEALNHANLVKLKKYGQVVVDETSLVYAVMESAEANLGEIVQERRLTVLETKQLAASVVAALEALHGSGFVHEHMEAGNVLAVGEVIKLRSDCIREAPEGEEGRALKRKDVQDFAVVLLRALTQQRTLEAASRDLPLPEPFDAIVKKGMSGEWGLREISAALGPVTPAAPARPAARPVGAKPVAPSAAVRPVVAPTAAVAEKPVVAAMPHRERVAAVEEDEPQQRGVKKIAYVVVALLLLLLGWYLLRGRSANSGAAKEASAPPAAVQGESSPAVSAPVASAPAVTTQAPVRQSADGRGVWRVIAYTYNHESQAKEKAGTIAQRHPELRPEVFTPSGRAPYLVAIGGAMSRDDAFSLARKARGEGLPRDIYAQNYGGKAR
jgi:hypothetical protein